MEAAKHTAGPWWADWEGTINEAKQHMSFREIAVEYRLRSNLAPNASERDLWRRCANDAQKRANNCAEVVRYCAQAIEREARAAIAKATQS